MALLPSRLCLLLLVFGPLAMAQEPFDPYKDGPHTVLRLAVNSTTIPGLPVNLDIWAPREGGTFIPYYFMDSFGAFTPGDYYDLVLERISSHGGVIVLPWLAFTGLTADEKVPHVQAVIDWCEANLQESLVEYGADPGLVVDFSKSIAMSHSAGGHMLCSYLSVMGCGPFIGLAMMSPVDGADPYGIIEDYCITPGEYVNYVIPTLILPAGLDPVELLAGAACGPAELSNQRFYDASNPANSKWFINATRWGHVDFMDPGFQSLVAQTHFCAVNEDASLLQFQTYRDHTAGMIIAFVTGLLADDCTPYFQYIQDPSWMLIEVDSMFELAGGRNCPLSPTCTWTPK